MPLIMEAQGASAPDYRDLHTLEHDAFPLEIDQHGASARTAQALPALRRGATVFLVVPSGTLFFLRLGLRT
jgi:hypothetical protein